MDAVLSYENGMLEICLNGHTIQATAEGSLPGLTRISGIRTINLSKVLPTDDPLIIAFDGERLYMGSFSIPCVWHNVEANPIQLPIDPSLTTLLGLRLQYKEDEIFTSGFSQLVNEAEGKRKMLVRRAANVLEPLGVRLEDVERLVDEAVRRANHL
jgi:hypothetical protein